MPTETPDFTPEAITAIALGVITNLVVLFGLDITEAQKGAITGLVTSVVLAAFLIHSAVIRQGRAKVVAASIAAGHGLPQRS